MSAISKSNNKKRSLAVTAYETIIRKIISMEYASGEHLEEKQLMEELGIGRTPIREALLRLVSENMVESHPNKGIIVKGITVQDTKAMFEAMKILELGVADLVLKKNLNSLIEKMISVNEEVKTAIESMSVYDIVEANHRFHILFAQCSHNEYLIRGLNNVRNQAKRLSYLSYANMIDTEIPLKSHYDAVIEEHNSIITFLREKNIEQLKLTITKHIKIFQQRIILFMTS